MPEYICKNKKLYEYIEKNLPLIRARAIGALETPELQIVCKKLIYSSEKIAKAELKRISEMKNNHKIPIGSYYCEVCGGFHLTSKPLVLMIISLH